MVSMTTYDNAHIDSVLSTVTQEQFTILLCYHKGITDPCRQCGGLGTYMYSDCSTWRRGGIAGQAFTRDVCDCCWGTGDANKHGLDLRQLDNTTRRLAHVAVFDMVKTALKCNTQYARQFIEHYADHIEVLSRRRKLPPFITGQSEGKMYASVRGTDMYQETARRFATFLRNIVMDVDDVVNSNADK